MLLVFLAQVGHRVPPDLLACLEQLEAQDVMVIQALLAV